MASTSRKVVDDLSSDFDAASQVDRSELTKSCMDAELMKKAKIPFEAKADKSFFRSQQDRFEGSAFHRSSLLALNAYDRHKRLINEYLLQRPGATQLLKRDTSRDRTDLDVIRQNHKFLWDDAEAVTWEQKLAKRYYDKLFREYCIVDLSCLLDGLAINTAPQFRLYKENKIAMRWRTEKEVVDGKGQFVCGDKNCHEAGGESGLTSWEVNFAYVEDGVKRNALVKVRLCQSCSKKLNFHHARKEIKPKRRLKTSDAEVSQRRKRRRSDEDTDTIELDAVSDEKLKTAKAADGDTKDEHSESNVWSKPLQLEEEKSRTDEFEQYLEDLFL